MSLTSPFPADIGFQVCIDSTGGETLFPEEQALLAADTHPKRLLGFTLGRCAAHAALRQLGVQVQPLLIRAGREPLWPDAVRGSISHTNHGERCAAVAAVALKNSYAGIGVDLEPAERELSEAVAKRISRPDDRAWALRSEQGRLRNALKLFSAKEALFKAFFPLYPHAMSFQQAELTWNEEHSSFHARIHLPPGTSTPIRCEVVVREERGLLLTAVALPVSVLDVFQKP